eukprot:scaffold47634_cov18-Tisochrysis_lutea.AAC.6
MQRAHLTTRAPMHPPLFRTGTHAHSHLMPSRTLMSAECTSRSTSADAPASGSSSVARSYCTRPPHSSSPGGRLPAAAQSTRGVLPSPANSCSSAAPVGPPKPKVASSSSSLPPAHTAKARGACACSCSMHWRSTRARAAFPQAQARASHVDSGLHSVR